MIEKSLERQWKGKVLYKRRETTERYISISSPAITISVRLDLTRAISIVTGYQIVDGLLNF